MSTVVELFQAVQQPDVVATPAQPESAVAPAIPVLEGWESARFAQTQIHSLVRQVFFPGRAKASRHIVICAVDESTYIAEICMEVARALSWQVAGSVCVAEANAHKPELESVFWRTDDPSRSNDADRKDDVFGSLRNASQNISPNLWLAPRKLLFGESQLSVDSLARRLSDFRLEFDYTVLHGPPAGCYSEAAALAQLSDGVALVVEANATRRVAAQKTKEALQTAHARLLGVVLSERTFPIPEKLYRKL